jgi:hypothetical protein
MFSLYGHEPVKVALDIVHLALDIDEKAGHALYLNWISVLDANPAGSRRMVEGFVDAIEYSNRFGP